MEQWTVIRQAIAQNRDIAELMTAGLQGERALDSADQLRLEQMLAEQAWAAFHIWDRTQRGIFPKGTFEATGGALLATLLRTPGGAVWWPSAKQTGYGFPPGFVADVDAILAKTRPRDAANRGPSLCLRLRACEHQFLLARSLVLSLVGFSLSAAALL